MGNSNLSWNFDREIGEWERYRYQCYTLRRSHIKKKPLRNTRFRAIFFFTYFLQWFCRSVVLFYHWEKLTEIINQKQKCLQLPAWGDDAIAEINYQSKLATQRSQNQNIQYVNGIHKTNEPAPQMVGTWVLANSNNNHISKFREIIPLNVHTKNGTYIGLRKANFIFREIRN
jgi:hypothetical protein